ncbi:pyruvate formate-lyase-activating protein [Culicoidibacter larvae]|uniref:Pyruvate formate-lyase-activating enzyme n=1 Tax=Culicoidibacter larvae TaxID=2579976 RepID=A0A5R8QBT0_9FIRM|nr:pyruvate formate-lyase-activating protein [Culicoidibacter larvae]TLG73784.1 pyruvate formate lyase-activating protein [Culicoidibacter larvae]
MIGNIHSIETFGTVDGPGVRFVVFMQGCPLRCQYCHNPDTWKTGVGQKWTTDELLDEYEKYKVFLRGGGITITGGEPLLQIDFVTELFKKARERGIHTCIDTSGVTFRIKSETGMEKFTELMQYTDLVLLDLKHIETTAHKELTGVPNEAILRFALWLDKIGKPVWIRHVVIPGVTLNDRSLYQLGLFIGRLNNVEALDVLPYHVMGLSKWNALGWEYPLEGVEPATKDEAERARKIIKKGIHDRKVRIAESAAE